MTAESWCLLTGILLAISILSGTMLYSYDAPASRTASPTFLVASKSDNAPGTIERFAIDLAATGSVMHVGTEARDVAASFMAISHDGRLLCSVGEVMVDGKNKEAADLFAIEREGGPLKHLDREFLPDGGACHVIFDTADSHVLISIYGDGQEVVLPIEAGNSLGSATSLIKHPAAPLGPQKDRQDNAHAHSTLLAPGGQIALVADLGTDRLMLYDLADGVLKQHATPHLTLPAGAGPRHATFDGNGERLYVLNELDSTICVFDWDAKLGAGTIKQTVPMLPENYKGPTNTAAEIRMHLSGKFLYATNRGDDSIAMYAVDRSTGLLKLIGREPTRGNHPRHFTIDPTGHWLIVANLFSDTLAVFAIDTETGTLRPVGATIPVAHPYCVLFTN